MSVFIFFILLCGPAAAEDLSPQGTVKSLLDAIKNIKAGDNPSAEQKEINRGYSNAAISLMDMNGVSRKSLGKHWKNRTPEEQREFVTVLGDLFRKIAFPNSAKFFSDLKMIYGNSEIKKNRARVPLTVVHKDEGEIVIDFVLHKAANKWLIIEVILDDVSMRNNLRSQFYKVIKKNSYRELVRRMVKKLKKAAEKG